MKRKRRRAPEPAVLRFVKALESWQSGRCARVCVSTPVTDIL